MNRRHPSASAPRAGKVVHRAPGLLIALAIIGVVGLCSSLASADTPTTHTTVASAGTQTNVAPPGPINDLADGTSVTVRVTEHSSADPIFGIVRIAQCKGGAAIANDADMTPDVTGRCLDQGLGSGMAFNTQITKAAVTDNFVQTTFKVGTGTRSVAYDDGTSPPPSTITCDAAHDCTLWVEIARTNGSDFVHFNLHFGPASGTTTTTAAGGTTTTTAVGGTTTTTAAGGTTTTTAAGGTTTTTAAGGTTTTTVPVACPTTSTTSTTAPSTTTSTTTGASTTSTTAGTTTTTTASATTTTLPAGTTVASSTPAGGSLSVSSTGWKPGSSVTGTLCSTPVALGTLTADSTGKIVGSFTVPATTAPGSHDLVLAGLDAASAKRTVTAGVTITAAAGATTTTGANTPTTLASRTGLPATGANVAKLLLSAVLIVFAGWLLSVSAYRRRGRVGPGW